MNYFSKLLFTRTPFDQLQQHMEKVVACLAKLSEIFHHLYDNQYDQLEPLVEKVSHFEHEADLIKNDIRKSLTKSFLFSIDRNVFLDLLTLQDNLADTAEEIAGLLIIKSLTVPPEIADELKAYIDKNMECAWDIKEIVLSFDQLIEASFGGPVATHVKQQVDQIAYKEHQASCLRRKVTKQLFGIADQLAMSDFILWTRLVEEIGYIAHSAEKVALRIEMILDGKS